MTFKPSYYHCYKGSKYICSGTISEIADTLKLSIYTVKTYSSGVGGHKYQIYRNDPRSKDLIDMKIYGVTDFEEHRINLF